MKPRMLSTDTHGDSFSGTCIHLSVTESIHRRGCLNAATGTSALLFYMANGRSDTLTSLQLPQSATHICQGIQETAEESVADVGRALGTECLSFRKRIGTMSVRCTARAL